MIKTTRHLGSVALALAGLVASSGAFAQSWDLDACARAVAGACTSAGSTVSISGYYSNGASSNFQAGSLNIGTNGQEWMGVNSKNGGGTTEDQNSPNHAIDNYNSGSAVGATGGATYAEMVLLTFTKAVDLNKIVAVWNNGSTGTGAQFQVWRWDNTSSTTPNALTTYNANAMTGWSSVTTTSGDFSTLSQNITDGTYFSSYWLVTTKFGGTNDAFKLGTVSSSVAACTGTGTSTGACSSTSTGVPEPMSLALFGIAALGAGAARRRAKAQRA